MPFWSAQRKAMERYWSHFSQVPWNIRFWFEKHYPRTLDILIILNYAQTSAKKHWKKQCCSTMNTQNSEHSAKFNFFLCISFCTCWAMTELYGLLGLSPNGPVTAADIRSAYLRNALQADPDKGGSKEPGATWVHWANLTCIYVEYVSWMACHSKHQVFKSSCACW